MVNYWPEFDESRHAYETRNPSDELCNRFRASNLIVNFPEFFGLSFALGRKCAYGIFQFTDSHTQVDYGRC